MSTKSVCQLDFLTFFERKILGECPITIEAANLQRTMGRQYREQISEAVAEYYHQGKTELAKEEFERIWRLSMYMIAIHYERAEIIKKLLKIQELEVIGRLAP